jgi:hypothetical protein
MPDDIRLSNVTSGGSINVTLPVMLHKSTNVTSSVNVTSRSSQPGVEGSTPTGSEGNPTPPATLKTRQPTPFKPPRDCRTCLRKCYCRKAIQCQAIPPGFFPCLDYLSPPKNPTPPETLETIPLTNTLNTSDIRETCVEPEASLSVLEDGLIPPGVEGSTHQKEF